MRVAEARLDAGLALHAASALSKILGVLPPAARAAADSVAVLAPPVEADAPARERLQALRHAVEARRKLGLVYRDLKEQLSQRTVRPLGCVYWGQVWTLAAWCEDKSGFRNFRVDRIERLDLLDARFRDEPGKTLADLLRAVGLEGDKAASTKTGARTRPA